MAFNRYDRITPLEFEFAEYPLQPLLLGLQEKQKRFDINLENAEKLYNQSIKALPQDRADANAIIKGYQDQIDNIINEYKGDYSRIAPKIRFLQKDMFRNFSPGGRADAIQTSYNNYYKALQDETERVKKGEILADQLSAWSNYTLGNYKGVQEGEGGVYSILSPESIAQYQDINKIAFDFAKELDPQKFSVEEDRVNGSWIVREKQSGAILRPEDIAFQLENRLLSDHGIINYAQQFLRFANRPTDENTVRQLFIDNVAKNTAKAFGVNDTESSRLLRENKFALQGNDHRFRKLQFDQLLKPDPTYTMPGITFNPAIPDIKITNLTETNIWENSGGKLGTGASSESLLSKEVSKSFSEVIASQVEKVEGTVHEDTYKSIYRNIDNNSSLTEEQKKREFSTTWEDYKKRITANAVNTSMIPLDPGVWASMKEQWTGEIEGAVWKEITPQGTVRDVQLTKTMREAAKEGTLVPTAINMMTGDAGLVVNWKNKQYIVTNTRLHDKIGAQAISIQKMYAPYINGQPGDVTITKMIEMPNGLSLPVPMRVETTLDENGKLKGQFTVFDPSQQKEVTAPIEDIGSFINSQLIQAGQNIQSGVKLDNSILNRGNVKNDPESIYRLFDMLNNSYQNYE